jgi:hypothetical protein
MSSAKPIRVFWSRAALDAAGARMPSLQRTLVSECGEIGGEARDWFVHVVEHEAIGASFLCNGEEHPGEWQVFVQLVGFEELVVPASPADLPAVCMPRAARIDGNDEFHETPLVQ